MFKKSDAMQRKAKKNLAKVELSRVALKNA